MKNQDTIFNKRLFGNENKYIQEVLESEFVSSKGSVMMRRLETEFAQKFGSQFAIAHINGTATMHALLEALSLSPGDEVIVPPLTMAATTFAVLQANLTPVFADVDLDTFQISAQSIRSRISSRTKAIITVALYGLSPDMDEIMSIAKDYNLFVIEDNAQCFLGRYKGRLVGKLGHAASFSFQSSKHITSGEGGIVITDDLAIAEKVRRIGSLGYAGVSSTKGKISKNDIQDPHYSRHVSMGWNYRMSELCCAVALAQVENLGALVTRRIQVANLFAEVVEECSWLKPQVVPSGYLHSYWTYAVLLEHPTLNWYQFRDRFQELGGDGIYAAWKLTYQEPAIQQKAFLGRERWISSNALSSYNSGSCPVAERIQPKILQFQTNYWDLEEAKKQRDVLVKTIRSYE